MRAIGFGISILEHLYTNSSINTTAYADTFYRSNTVERIRNAKNNITRYVTLRFITRHS